MNRRDFLNCVTAAGIGAGAALVAGKHDPAAAKTDKDTAERILDTRKMNCSYIPYAPVFIKDPNSGKFSGIFYDLTEKLGEMAGVEINWNAETTYATFTEDLRQKKSDVFAGGIWSNVNRAKAVNFSLPAVYSGYGVYVRGDDRRFDASFAKLNDARFRLATIDGEMSQTVQQSDFPQASVLGLPNNTDISMLAECVVTGKADATFLEKAAAAVYIRKNPGALRNVASNNPIRIFENTWAFAYGSDRLKNMIDTAVKEMIYSGYVGRVLAKYGQTDGFYGVRSPV